MGLSDLLKPFKELKKHTYDELDKVILRHYTKKITKIEREGGSRYEYIKYEKLKGLATYVTNYCTGVALGHGWSHIAVLNSAVDSIDATVMAKERDLGEQSETKVAPNEATYTVDKLLKKSRLPLMLSGISLMGYAFYDLATNAENPNWNFTGYVFGMGYQQFITAKSIYARSIDPKILEKSPMWKQALNKIAEYVSSPQPVPVKSNG